MIGKGDDGKTWRTLDFYFSYLLSKSLMYKLGTLIFWYSFVFSLWIEALVSIE